MNAKQKQALKVILKTDGYKINHKNMYRKGITKLVSNLTPRSDEHSPVKGYITTFGADYVVAKLRDEWKCFFELNHKEMTDVLSEYSKIIGEYFGNTSEKIEDCFQVSHLYRLWEEKELPIKFMALPNGIRSKIGVPVLQMWNTEDHAYWLVNYLETYISQQLWPLMTVSTIAYEFKDIAETWAIRTSSQNFIDNLLDYQMHDFSSRGICGDGGAELIGMAHIYHHSGTDNLPAMLEYKKYYPNDKRAIMSVPATEHSVMCSYGKKNELEAYRELLRRYPTGVLSIVSDTWDYFNVLTNILPQLKEEILKRDGVVVIRPDSGNPKEILLGQNIEKANLFLEPQEAGSLKLLAKTFGYYMNEKGYKVLNDKIRVIYGDSMTLDSVEDILFTAEKMGWASENFVFGIGAFSYQLNTRDTHGFAFKATAIEVDGKIIPIFKEPITASFKKSAKGILNVKNGVLIENTTFEEIDKQSDWKEI